MPPIRKITIVFDDACGLCTRVKDWIAQQTPLVGLQFAVSGAPQTRAMFPTLPAGELAVVADTGEVWLGDNAWIVCLWALRDYRGLSVKLTGPLLSTMAREAFSLVSRNRAALSGLLRLRSERELEQELRRVVVPKCIGTA
jgi:predicted DCC family thiol-disulfide oxidoreductase YuxK